MDNDCFRYEVPSRQPMLIVISGPSGVGKDSVLQAMKKRDLPLHFVVTATSRPPRTGEVNGVDYFFVSESAFEQMIADNELLEHAVVYGQYKGIPKKQIREAMATGKDVILRIDVQGAATIRSLCPDTVMIFLIPASSEELITRLAERNTETPEHLKIRLETACKEMQRLPEFNYVVVNQQDKLEETVDQIVSIIAVEHLRTVPRKVNL